MRSGRAAVTAAIGCLFATAATRLPQINRFGRVGRKSTRRAGDPSVNISNPTSGVTRGMVKIRTAKAGNGNAGVGLQAQRARRLVAERFPSRIESVRPARSEYLAVMVGCPRPPRNAVPMADTFFDRASGLRSPPAAISLDGGLAAFFRGTFRASSLPRPSNRRFAQQAPWRESASARRGHAR